MKRITKTYNAAGIGFMLAAEDGEIVSVSAMPDGFVLRRSSDAETWVEEIRTPPFAHVGQAASYRIDCDTYEGTPKVATLEIE